MNSWPLLKRRQGKSPFPNIAGIDMLQVGLREVRWTSGPPGRGQSQDRAHASEHLKDP